MADKKIAPELNKLLGEEVQAIAQYSVHAEICDNWGYKELHDTLMNTAKKEMHHMANLIERMVFLGIKVDVTLPSFKTGADVAEIIDLSAEAEADAINHYNEVILLARDEKDAGTYKMLEQHVLDEEEHLNYWQAQQDQIKQMGIETYLSNQVA